MCGQILQLQTNAATAIPLLHDSRVKKPNKSHVSLSSRIKKYLNSWDAYVSRFPTWKTIADDFVDEIHVDFHYSGMGYGRPKGNGYGGTTVWSV